MTKSNVVYTYFSACCDTQARKAPCERSKTDSKEKKFSQSSLGKWHCSTCKKGCKVRRTKIKEDVGNDTGIHTA